MVSSEAAVIPALVCDGLVVIVVAAIVVVVVVVLGVVVVDVVVVVVSEIQRKTRIGVYPRMVYRLAIVMPPPTPFWMTENEFRSHSSPFQINTQLFIFLFLFHKMAAGGITENHFRSHFSPFQINTQLFLGFCSQNGCRWPFWMTENHF